MNIGFSVSEGLEKAEANMLPGRANNLAEYAAILAEAGGSEGAIAFVSIPAENGATNSRDDLNPAVEIIERLAELHHEQTGSIRLVLEHAFEEIFEAGRAYERSLRAEVQCTHE